MKRIWAWTGPLGVLRTLALYVIAFGLILLFDLGTMKLTLAFRGLGHLGSQIVACGGFLDNLQALPFCVSP